MSTVVIVPPSPFMTPADVPGRHEIDDPTVAAYIAAAVATIDGPYGWVGRAFGVQTLERRTASFPWCTEIELAYPPVVSIESISYVDTAGNAVSISSDDVDLDQLNGVLRPVSGRWPAASGPAGAVRIRYVAGYNGTPVAEGGTGNVPEQVKQAVALLVQDLRSTGTETQDLKVVDLEGIGRREWFVSRADSAQMNTAAERLLAGLRVFR